MHVLFEGGHDNVQAFFSAVNELIGSIDYKGMDAQTFKADLWYKVIESNQNGRYEIIVPHLIKVQGGWCTASMVIEARSCSLVLRDGRVCVRFCDDKEYALKATLENIIHVKPVLNVSWWGNWSFY